MSASAPDTQSSSLGDLIEDVARRWKLLVAVPLLLGAVGLAVSFALPETFTARTTFIPPQQPGGQAATAIASLGALSNLAGLGQGIRTSADQYASLLESSNVRDRLIDEFKLMEVYGVTMRADARDALASRVRISIGKKDGMMAVEVDDRSPERAAEIANRHISELRRLMSHLALTEAQQRRAFFEREVQQVKAKLDKAQLALQASGFNLAALRTEPRAAADAYSRLRAEVTAAEVRVQAMRRSLTDDSAEIQAQLSMLGQLRAQLGKLEDTSRGTTSDYTALYRDFKYQETLYELFSRQYEVARLDEARDGAILQVVDAATPPERRSAPKRRVIALLSAGVGAAGTLLVLIALSAWRLQSAASGSAAPQRAGT